MARVEKMNIFIENPSCFRMNKNSATAAMLKTSILNKLNQFFGNYTDDVLAEYIVVLVCNGKDQNQAKDHLEAFLGDRSAEFVSWLWDLLLGSATDFHMIGVGQKKHKLRKLKGLHKHVKGDANTLPNNEHEYIPSTYVPLPISLDKNEVFEGSEHCSQRFDTSLNESEMEQQKQSFKLPKISRPTQDNSCDIPKYEPSKVKVSFGLSVNSEQSMIPANEKKISINENHLPRQRIPVPKDERPSRNLRSITKENPKYGLPSRTGVTENRFSPRSLDSLSCKSGTRRASVWDRLGRTHNVTTTTEAHNINAVKRKIEENFDDTHYQNRPIHFSSGARSDRSLKREINSSDIFSDTVISDTSNDGDDKRLKYDMSPADRTNRKRQFSDTGSAEESKYRHLHYTKPLKQFEISSSGTRQTKLLQTCPDVSTSNDDDAKRLEYALNPVDRPNRKIQFSEIGSVEDSKYRHPHFSKPLTQFERSSPAKYTSTESLNSISSGIRQTKLLQTCPDVSPRKMNGEALGFAKTNVNPVQSQLLDMKLRLHQIEMQMSSLKSRQLESNEGNPEVLSNSGASNRSEEDVESRTVFVMNVHFAATKEALILYFSKCGVVVNTILLNEPKGSAYVFFLQKEAADKAVALSGTSFWSRTLKIVRKREMPMVAPFVMTGNPSSPKPKLLQPNRKFVFTRPYAGSLQWRRDQVVNTGSSDHAPTSVLEDSETAQQKGNDSEGQVCDLSMTNTETVKEESIETQYKEEPKETQEAEETGKPRIHRELGVDEDLQRLFS